MSSAWASLAELVTAAAPSPPPMPSGLTTYPLELPTRAELVGMRTPATPATATALPSVWACVEIIVNTALQVPLTARQQSMPAPLPEWLRRPERYNGGAARFDQLLEHVLTGQALHGAGYLWGVPLGADSWALTPVDNGRVTVDLEANGKSQQRVWHVDGEPVPVARRWSTRPNSPGLVVVPHRLLPGVPAPVGPVQAARLAVGGYLETDAYGADVFGQGVPQGVLETEQEITRDTATRYRDDWRTGAREPVRVLGNGFRFTPFRLSPKDAAWLEARRFNAEEIARMFSVPAYKLNLTQSGGLVYSNAENLDGDFLRSCVAGGYLRPVEAALDQLTPPGRNAADELAMRFDYTALLRATTTERFDAYTAALQGGWMTVDEVRAREGLPPLPADARPEVPAA